LAVELFAAPPEGLFCEESAGWYPILKDSDLLSVSTGTRVILASYRPRLGEARLSTAVVPTAPKILLKTWLAGRPSIFCPSMENNRSPTATPARAAGPPGTTLVTTSRPCWFQL